MSLKLAILGLLLDRDMHPYEIGQTMKERNMHLYMKIQEGSLYYAVDQLKKDGYIAAVEVIREPNRPDKTIYRITDKGRELFQELLLQQFTMKTIMEHPVYSALQFAGHGDQAKIAELLEHRIAEAEQLVKTMREVYEEHLPVVPKGALHLMAGCYEHALTDLKWLRRLWKDAKEGRLGEVHAPLDIIFEE
jgi:DNA-binding PadR family transcriptional regulator